MPVICPRLIVGVVIDEVGRRPSITADKLRAVAKIVVLGREHDGRPAGAALRGAHQVALRVVGIGVRREVIGLGNDPPRRIVGVLNRVLGVFLGVSIGHVGIPGLRRDLVLRIILVLPHPPVVVHVARQVAGRIVRIILAVAQGIGFLDHPVLLVVDPSGRVAVGIGQAGQVAGAIVGKAGRTAVGVGDAGHSPGGVECIGRRPQRLRTSRPLERPATSSLLRHRPAGCWSAGSG